MFEVGSLLYKYHYLVVFSVALVPFMSELYQKEKKSQALYLISGLTFIYLTLFTGLSFFFQKSSMTTATYLHAILGGFTLFALGASFLYRKNRIKKFYGLAATFILLSLTSGVYSNYGKRYFFVTESTFTPAAKVHLILDKKCSSCHDGKDPHFSVDSPESYINPNQPKLSLLYHVISKPTWDSLHMPKISGQLSDTEKEVILNWIKSHKGEKKAEAYHQRERHWALSLFQKPTVSPDATVDDFIRKAFPNIEYKELPKTKILRRLSLQLNGRYLNPDEYRSLASQSWPEIISYFLDSKRYGIQMAHFFFDRVAFADEPGVGDSYTFKGSLSYREKVVAFYNEDQNYLEFMKDELSWQKGSLWDQKKHDKLIAFLPSDETRNQLGLTNHFNAIFTNALGVNMKCAKCHDHPFIPLKKEEVWSLYSFYQEFHKDSSFKKKAVIPEIPWEQRTSRYQQEFVSRSPANIATWLTDTKDGSGILNARLYVNSIWAFLMGSPILNNPKEVYHIEEKPKLLPLLNWLTYYFIENNNSTKKLIQKIVLSKSYLSRNLYREGIKKETPLSPLILRDCLQQLSYSLDPNKVPQTKLILK